MRMKVSNYIAKLLVQNGITDVFMITGGGAMHLDDGLGHEPGLHCVYNHHEQACAIAAESYARIHNRIAAVCVTTGPGGTNAITGVVGGWLDSIPMLVISGQVRYDVTARSTGLGIRAFGDQEYDICKSVEPMTKYCEMVIDPKRIRYAVEKALYLAQTGRPGPCWLDIPLNVQGATVEIDELEGFDPTKENLTANNVVITDKFAQKDGMTYDADSMEVKLNKEDITKDCKITVEGNNFKIETGKNISDEDKLEVSYKVSFSKTGEYTNTAVSTSDNTNEDQATNVIEVTNVTPELSINKTSDKTEYAVGNTGIYTLTVKQTKADATAKNVTVKDQFVQEDGITIDAESMKVSLNGTDITKDCKIVTNQNNFTIETGKDLSSKDELLVSYNVTYTKEGTYKNTATTQADNADPKDDNNSVTVVDQDVTMTKDADKKEYKVGDMVKYNVSVSLKKENSVSKDVVINDTIPEGLALQSESVKVNGITDYTINTDGNKLEVKIPELKYGEKVEVNYQAKVLKSALGKTLVNKATVNGSGIHPGQAEVSVKVPKTEKTPTSTNGSGSQTTTVKTGDDFNAIPYVAGIALGAVAGVVIYLKRRKLKK